MEQITTVYKIRRKSDGHYSTGGMTPRFRTKGKTWKTQGHLTSHLMNVVGIKKCPQIYGGCEIIVIERRETEVSQISISEYVLTKEQTKLKEKLDHEKKARHEQFLRIAEEYERLKIEFESEE